MKILYLMETGFDTPNGNNHLALAMIDDFLKANISVHMISSRTRGLDSDIPELLSGRNNFTYDIINKKVIKKNRFVLRYLSGIRYAYKASKYWSNIKDADLVLVQSSPTVFFSIRLLFKRFKKPIVYNVYDIFPGSAYDIGVIKSRFLNNFFKKMQRFVYKKCDIIVGVSNDMKQKLITEGVDEKKIRVVVNWYDDKYVKEVDVKNNKFIEKYDIDTSKFYVQYAGNMGQVFDYKMIFEAAKELRNEDNIVFQLVGDGQSLSLLQEMVKNDKLDNVIFYPWQPLYIISDVYSACSIEIIPLKKGVIGNDVPSKAALLMACRRVVLNSVESESEYYNMFNINRIGMSVPNDSPKAVAEAIFKLYNNPDIIEEFANNAKLFGEKYYSKKNNTYKFIDIFNEVTIGAKNDVQR